MGQEKVFYSEQQRVDLPDFQFLIDSSEEELKDVLSSLFVKGGRVVKGFSLSVGVGLTALLDKSTERIAILETGLVSIDTEIGVPLSLDLVASSVNYIEIDFVHVPSNKELRPFYDIDAKEEFHKEVFTKDVLQTSIYINQSGYTAGRVKIGTMTTDVTDVTDSTDDREFIFQDGGYTWAGTRTDKDIESIDQSVNANYSITKELKGTANWFDVPVTNLQRIFDLSIASIVGDDSASIDLGTDLLTSPSFVLLMPNKSFNYVVDAISETLLDQESLYVVLPTNAAGNFILSGSNLSVTKVDSTSFPNDSKNFLICTRIGNTVAFNKGALKLADFGSDIVITDGASMAAALSVIDAKVAANIADILKNLDSPLSMGQSTVADAVLNLSLAPTLLSDGAKRALPPISSQVFELAASTINFQTQATTGGPFEITWPVTSVVSKYQRVGFSLLASGAIKGLFSAEANDIPSLANAGSLLISSGIPIGYIDLIVTDVLGKWKTANSSTSIIENADIFRFGSGGSGGSGSGDASQLLTRLEDALDDSFYGYLEPNIISLDEGTKVDSTDAVFDFVTRTYGFTTGNILTSYELLDIDFLSELNDVLKAQVAITFDKSAIDSAPIVHLTNNGVDFQAVGMERVSPSSDTFIGTHVFDLDTLVKQNLFEYNVSEADGVTVLNATTIQGIAEEFTTGANVNVLEEINLYLNKVGTPTGYVIAKLYTDSAGPDILISQARLNIAGMTNGINTFSIGRQVLAKNTKYFISIETDSEYKTTYVGGVDEVNVQMDTSVPTIADALSFNGTIWAAISGKAMVHLIKGRVLDLRLRYTAFEDSNLVGYGVYYGHSAENTKKTLKRSSFIFDGTIDNLNEFTLGFVGNADLLRIEDRITGQIWGVPSFTLSGSGKTVVFPVGFFNGSGAVHLIAHENDGSAYDNNDTNRNVISENFLGSLDDDLDYSSPGRGPKLRDEIDSKQYEIYISGGALKMRFIRD